MQDKSLSVEKRVESILKYVNKIYAPLRIQFRVVQIDVLTTQLLMDTSEYYIPHELKAYKSQIVNPLHDCLHLFMRPKSNLKRSGYGVKFSMCSRSSCVGHTIDSLSGNIDDTAFIMAHELGHNFELSHDTSTCGCLGCIMATGVEISSRSQNWSQCSVKDIESILRHGVHSCLAFSPVNRTIKITYVSEGWSQRRSNYDIITLKTSYCGNGLVEEEEQCDCLGKFNCDRCCNMVTCRFLAGAMCANGPCCNMTSCKVMTKGNLCRSSTDPCDITEYCSGISKACGADLYIADGTPCITIYNESAFCFDGKCRNHLTQCRLFWGDSAKVSSTLCYLENRNNNHKFKNCGNAMTRKSLIIKSDVSFNDRPIACETGDEFCGRLWCNHQNERLMTLGVSESFAFMQGDHFCQALKFEYDWRMRDIGIVPDGSLCGTNKVCHKMKCVARLNSKCHCNGHGVCNNLNQCHCENGFTGLYCNQTDTISPTIPSQIYNQTDQSGSSHDSRRYTAIGIVIFLLVILVVVIMIKIIENLKDKREFYEISDRSGHNYRDTISKITFKASFLKEKLRKKGNNDNERDIVNGIIEP